MIINDYIPDWTEMPGPYDVDSFEKPIPLCPYCFCDVAEPGMICNQCRDDLAELDGE